MTTSYPALEMTGLLKKEKGKKEPPKLLTLIEEAVNAIDSKEAMKKKMLEEVHANQQVKFRANADVWKEKIRPLVKASARMNDKGLWEGDNRENNAHPFVKYVKQKVGEFGSRGTNYLIRSVIVWVAVDEWHAKSFDEVWRPLRLTNDVEKWEDATRRVKELNDKRDKMVEGLMEALRIKVNHRVAKPRSAWPVSGTTEDQDEPGLVTEMETEVMDGLNTADDSDLVINDEEEEEEGEQQQPNKKKDRKDCSHSDGVLVVLDKYNPKTPSELYEASIEYETVGKALWKIADDTLNIVTDWSNPKALKTNDDEDETLQHCTLLCKMFEKGKVPQMLMNLSLAKNIYRASRACEDRMLEDEPAAKRARSNLPPPFPDSVDSDGDE